MTRAPHPDFRKAWQVSFANVLLCALPLDIVLGMNWWTGFTAAWCMLGLGWFAAAEYLARVARAMGFSGTKTSLIFWIVEDDEHPLWADVWRSILGLAMGLVIYWRLPHGVYLGHGLGHDLYLSNLLVGGFFVTWLPYHYTKPGIRGPWEWLGSLLIQLPPFRQIKRWGDA